MIKSIHQRTLSMLLIKRIETRNLEYTGNNKSKGKNIKKRILPMLTIKRIHRRALYIRMIRRTERRTLVFLL